MDCQELALFWSTRWPRPSAQSNRQHRSSVRAWGEENAGVPLEDYTREMAREYALRFPSRARYLRAMFADAQRDSLVSQNPFAALRIAKPRRERYFPSTEEVQNLIRAAEEPLRGRIRFSAYTGLRLGEMLAVRPSEFNEDWMRIRVREQMNPQNERVPRKGKVKDYWAIVQPFCVEGIPDTDMERLLEWDQRLWPLTRAEHNKEWNALRRALKLPENFVWHSLRHHAATWFLDQGASDEDVAIQLGHSDGGVQVRDTYGHRDRGKALDRLEAIVGG